MKSMTFDQSTIMSDANNNSSGSLGGSMLSGSGTSSSINNPISNIGASINNNNIKKATNEKYSLRQRQKRQTSGRGAAAASGASATSSATLKDISSDQQPTVAKEKPKPKAAPLSKYRRKTANARERTRMREINSAFENLRRCVPHSIGGGGRTSPSSTNEKLTKITTLRLAMKYIRTLSEALTNPGYDVSFLCASNNNSNNFNNNNQVSSIPCTATSNFDNLFTQTVVEAPMVPVKVRTTAAKSQSRSRQKAKQKLEPASMDISIPMPSPCLEDNPADLGLLLESDGESLHLSEPCLSPLGQNMKPFNCNPANDNPLELSLLLDSDSDSLQFSEPCLSPLGALDSFNPFGDLLHTEFAEHTSLDMYLT